MRDKFQKLWGTLLPKQGGLVVACSGGVDSMVLLDLVRQTGGHLERGGRLVVAHFNHGLRGKESDLDEDLVKAYCVRHTLVFRTERYQGVGQSEAALRSARRDFLDRVRRELDCSKVLTAHHFDDNLETFCMRLIRGSSLRGLASMQPRRGVWLKPLLSFSKDEIVAWANGSVIPYREDDSNRGDRYFRNRVRHGLTPVIYKLASEYGGKGALRDRVVGLLDDLNWASQALVRTAKRADRKVILRTEYFYRLSVNIFLNYSVTVQRAILHQLLNELSTREFTRGDGDKIMNMISRKRKGVSLRGKIEVTESCGLVYFENNEHRINRKNILNAPQAPGVRYPEPGDRIHGSSKKLTRWLMEHRVPRLERKFVSVTIDPKSQGVIGVRLSSEFNADLKSGELSILSTK